MTTRCEDCEHLHADSRRDRRERAAMCVKFPRVMRADLVFNGITDKDEPFMRCTGINGGACPCFEPRRVEDG